MHLQSLQSLYSLYSPAPSITRQLKCLRGWQDINRAALRAGLAMLLSATAAQAQNARQGPPTSRDASKKGSDAALFDPNKVARATRIAPRKVDAYITISVPEGFVRLTGPAAHQHAAGAREPEALFADPAGEADLAITRAATFVEPGDEKIMQDMYRANLYSLYTKVTLLRQVIEDVGGKPAVVFELTGQVGKADGLQKPIRKYVYVQYMLRAKRVVVMTFTTDEKLRLRYQPLARRIMQSAKVQ